MQQDADAQDPILNLPDEAFFAMDQATEDKLLAEAAKSEEGRISIASPNQVDPAQVSELPVLYVRHTTGLRDWQVEFKRNSQLVAVDQLRGEVLSSWAFPTRKRFSPDQMDSSMDGAEPSGAEASSTNTEIYRLDARDILKLDWEEGSWAFTVVNYDWHSNTVVTRIGQTGAAEMAPAPIGLSEAQARAMVDELGPEGLLRVEQGSESPALDGEGVNLSAPAEASAATTTFPVRGSLRIPVPAGAVVESTAGAGAGKLPAAILRATVLVVKRDELHVSGVDMVVPVFSEVPVQAGDLVDAWFQVDLVEEGLLPLVVEGEALLYLVAGPHLFGPWKINAAD